MKVATLISKFNKYHPAEERSALVECKVPLQYLDSGCFRNVYTVPGTPGIVVKFPVSKRAKKHVRKESRGLDKIKQNPDLHEQMKPYLPTILYMNEYTGVTVMKQYAPIKWSAANNERVNKTATEIADIMGVEDTDGHRENFGQDAEGNIVLFDLGGLDGDPW